MSEKMSVKALIVDDEKVVRDFLTRLLSLESIEVTAVESGLKAIDAVKLTQFDLAFLDVRMPELDGLETLIELKKISPLTKYIMMTGYAVDDLMEKAKNEGIFASIRKPFDITQIMSFLKVTPQTATKDVINILIIDDDKDVLNFFKRFLRDKIYNITTVDNGKDALPIVKKREFDLVFLDIVLSDTSGLDLYSKIRELKPALDVILITGYTDKIKDMEQMDVKACLTKPFELDKILTEIDKIKVSRGL